MDEERELFNRGCWPLVPANAITSGLSQKILDKLFTAAVVRAGRKNAGPFIIDFGGLRRALTLHDMTNAAMAATVKIKC